MARQQRSQPPTIDVPFLLWGESVMTFLHVWILVGSSLPTLEQVMSQPIGMTYAYLLSDLLLPLLVWIRSRDFDLLQTYVVMVHSVLYFRFMTKFSSLDPVMQWAHSDWSHRRSYAGIVVIIDTACHAIGFARCWSDDRRRRGRRRGVKRRVYWTTLGALSAFLTFLSMKTTPL